MRDVYRRYDVYDNSNSLLAGLFPPLWLAYSQMVGSTYCLLNVDDAFISKYFYVSY